MPKVSVVIPTYNYANFIGEAIESIIAQTHPASEIIVGDDGSTDDTEQVVARFGSKVRYIKKENGGVCSARNTGIKTRPEISSHFLMPTTFPVRPESKNNLPNLRKTRKRV